MPSFLRRGERVEIDNYKQDGRPIPSMCECAENGAVEYMAINILQGKEEACNRPDETTGGHPIHYGAMRGHLDVCEFLIQHGAGINQPAAGTQETPLMWICRYNEDWAAKTGTNPIKDVKAIMDLGADPDVRDRTNRSAFTYSLHDPLLAHVLHVRGAQPVLSDLFYAIDQGWKRGVMYLLEQHRLTIDVNAQLSSPYTMKNGEAVDVPMRAAEECGNDLIVNFLRAQGAEGATKSPPRHTDYVGDNSNVKNILRVESISRFLAAAIVPNVALVGAAWYLPAVCGFLVLGFQLLLLNFYSSTSMKAKRPEPALAGWYLGCLVCGSIITITYTFEGMGPEYDNVKNVWWFVTIMMVVCYLRALLMDPGVVVPTAQQRKEVFDIVRAGFDVAESGCCVTTLCKRPNRSKFCTTSKKLVHRFDHYCVWTCNTIGGGNHRFFLGYVIFEVLSQALVFYFGGLYVDFWSLPFSSPCETFDVLFNKRNITVTYYMLIYNFFAFLFIISVLLTQLWYNSRNVTSNEVWFPNRYSWCFNVGSRTYTLYDRGCVENWREFLFGNLTGYTCDLPVIENNAHLMKILGAAKGAVITGGQTGADEEMGMGGHGHSHGGGHGGHGHSHGGGKSCCEHKNAAAARPQVPAAPAVVTRSLGEAEGAAPAMASAETEAPKATATEGSMNLTDPETGFIYPKQMASAILGLPLATRKIMAAKQAEQFRKHKIVDDSGTIQAPSAVDQARFDEEAERARRTADSSSAWSSGAATRSASRPQSGAQLRSSTRNHVE